MADRSNLQVSDISFFGIRNSIKEFISGQDQFRDYNFEAAGLVVIIDLLANNAYRDAVMANMIAGELFIDSAQLIENVMAHANKISYVPNSVRSASALITVTNDSVGDITLEAQTTIFTTSIDGRTFVFVPKEETLLIPAASAQIELIEGFPNTATFIQDDLDADQRFVLPDANIDTDTLSITVRNSIDDTTVERYILSDDINALDGESLIYFLKEVEERKFELFFGDNVLGNKPDNGQVIEAKFLISAGANANSAKSFTGPTGITVDSVDDVAAGGAAAQSKESVQFLSTRGYQAQNRGVTTRDYTVLIPDNFPDVESIACWGGEDNDPVRYGKVFISLKPISGVTISDFQKEQLAKTVVKTKNVVTIQPIFVDPDFTFLIVESAIKYDEAKTVSQAASLATDAKATITTYGDDELEKFNNAFRHSQLAQLIDATDRSFLSNNTSVRMQKRIVDPNTSVPITYTLLFGNALHNQQSTVLTSTEFMYLNPLDGTVVVASLEDDGVGNVIVVTSDTGVKTTIVPGAGTINYKTGKVEIVSFVPADAVDEIRVNVIPARFGTSDLTPVNNQILIIDPLDVTVTVDKETTLT